MLISLIKNNEIKGKSKKPDLIMIKMKKMKITYCFVILKAISESLNNFNQLPELTD